jgi:GNAT superfamily N-acetyltransferase
MKFIFANATTADAGALAELHRFVSVRLTLEYGHGFWSASPSERAIVSDMRKPKFSRTMTVRLNGRGIVGVLRLATKKPWAIDISCFTPAPRPLYLTGMAVHPDLQRQGVGRLLMKEAEAAARAWPADAIRLDAFDAPAGAGPFYAKCGYREVAHVVYKNDPLVYYELKLVA